jgi:hypothetical protein
MVGTGKLVAIGVATGLLGGFFGVGGGIILVPLLVWVGLGRHRAHATSLASFIVIATAGAISFGVADAVDLGVGVAVGVGGIFGSSVGASVMHRMSARNLAIAFALLLLVTGLRMVSGAEPLPGTSDFGGTKMILIGIAIGLISGLFAGLAGIGGGVVIIPATVLLLGLDQHVAQGTSLVAIVLTAIAGSVVNMRNQRVQIKDSLTIGAGGVIGSVVGVRLALGIDGRTLSIVFGFLVLFVAGRTLYRTLRRPVTA